MAGLGMSTRLARSADTPAPISEDDYRRFVNLIRQRTGLSFDESKRYFVEKRLQDCIQASGAEDFERWFGSVRIDQSGLEMQRLVNAMTVNETYFFREVYQFDCMVNHLLGEIVRHKMPGERIRIWSVPSSTGEEPYSIAIYLLERWPLINRYEVEILSSDIDTTVLAAAERGIYSPRAVALLPPQLLNRYFERLNVHEYRISADLVNAVHFSHLNICDAKAAQAYRDIDLIFCRNLLIYFDEPAQKQAMGALYDALVPGGFLCLGHSETMGKMPERFASRRFPDGLVHQKPVV
jgi:chemotaxis protein methyltransferase CheR